MHHAHSSSRAHPRTAIAAAAVTASMLAAGCGSEQSVNASGGRLSGATNRTLNSSAWGLNDSAIEERWDQDPTVMEPDYPIMAPQPGFGNQGGMNYGS